MKLPPFTLLAIVLSLVIHPLARDLAVGADPSSGNDEAPEMLLKAGGAIFAANCASCHGEHGEGTADYYPDPLTGDASIGELAEIITDTMPEEDPDQCVGADAEAVAAYIHHTFYSEAAQLRNRPPQLALQRLTGDQLRNSLSDLYGRFANIRRDKWEERTSQQGLEGKYYTGTKWDDENRKIERIDPVLDFDFELHGPQHADGSDAGINGEEFHAHWQGGVRIEETGRYEIVVRSTTSFTCSFGHDRNQLIDNHVQSAGRNEFRRSMLLTGGRTYPIKIDLNQRKRKGETPPASISLSWVPPGGVEQILPARNLVPGWVPAALRLETSMPPDDRTYGFPRGISVDPVWDEAVTSAELEFADSVCEELWPDYRNQHKREKIGHKKLFQQFLTELIAVAHRGVPDQVAADRIIDIAMTSHVDETEQIRHAILLALKSPRFLYPTLDADRTESQRAANRIALTLFDSLPADGWLIDQIRKTPSTDEDGRRNLARVLVDDARTRAKLREMFHHWLEISSADDLRKDEEEFPGFNAEVVSDLRSSLDAFIDAVVWSEASDYRQLVAADWTLTTPRLADFYGEKWQADDSDPAAAKAANVAWASDMSRSVSDAEVHVGVLTHPLVMAKLAHHRTTSPIHRGVFLVRHVMGRVLRPPNSAFTPLSPDLHPDLTTRQRVELQTSPDSCQTCHSKINPLGFALENFDAVGHYRMMEGDRPINAQGGYVSQADEHVEFESARQLGDYVAHSTDAQSAFVERVFQYFVKQPIAAYGTDQLEKLTQQFQDSHFNIRELLVEIAVISSRPAPQ
ncbi:DUF1588 domain-containing protein [Allorhodopirellula heiligendammensis]|uniref:PA14 domain protein n=1 Tax=Allorhodopirellula heiligendammensis TaxID=2714739 RepID=A0A5C6C5K9_9BACT|nr:DUF1588 domain-containing protein [Allorhodopirellula heiligendammensis]TWU19287.1 PA14 domain protein [Allorhodopirellula heiligendammensis]